MKKNYIKNMLGIISYNFKTLIKFEMIFKLLLSWVFMPLALFAFHFSMKITGYSYLTLENILDFLMNPLTILLLFIDVIFLTMVTLFDVSTLIVIFDEAYHKHKIDSVSAMKISLNQCRKVLRPRNISIVFLIMFLIPFLNIGLGSNVISSIKIPEFILDYIKSNSTLSILFVMVYFFLSFTLLKWIYSIHYMILEEDDFKEARKKSKNLMKGNMLKSQLKMFMVQFLIALFYLFFLFLGIFVIIWLYQLGTKEVVKSVLITIVWLFIFIFFTMSTIVSTSVSYAMISALFYQSKLKRNEKICSLKKKKNEKLIVKRRKILLKLAGIVIMILSLVGGSMLTYQIVTGKVNLSIEFIRKMEITAHRGASVSYPENTMLAFRKAKELRADWIELDVQQTKDRQIVVAHDANLLRVTGINQNIIDLEYAEIEKLDAGSFLNEEFKDAKIPLLKEVVSFAKGNKIRLNIELKPTGREDNFEQNVLDIINEYDYKDGCVITSQVYQVLENVKKIDSSFKTVYVMSIAIGNITELTYADAFSVEASNVNQSLVRMVHHDGKEILAWTVNTEEGITKMIDMGVDNIVTDNISLGKELVEKSRHSNLINELLKILQ